MRLYKIILLGILAFSLTACSITRNRMYAPESTRLNITMEDLEYLGECEISVDYRTYIGFISVVDAINGVQYNGDEIKTVKIADRRGNTLNLYPKLKRATYKLLENYPEAEYFVVVKQTKQAEKLFLGSEVTATARIKAYKLK